MQDRFRNRVHAGQVLASWLREYAARTDVSVLALARGGVPVGHEVARALGAPLDVLVVRKLGLPGHEELAIGAIGPGGVVVRNEELLTAYGVSPEEFARVLARERRELARRELAYRGRRAPPNVAGRTVLVVDDGIATGATMRAALRTARAWRAGAVVAAAPVAAREAIAELEKEVRTVVAVLRPAHFLAIGDFYLDFAATEDDEVRRLLDAAARPPPTPVFTPPVPPPP